MQYRDPFKTQPAWIAALASLATATPAIAQIVPDATLPNNSIVTPNGSSFTIDGGTTAGSNLFHSFSQFSIPTNTETFFNNATSIENIITRVTGSQISNIDGLIRANGTANLFLLNPNGIVFNENARLEIGGSFFGSTADSIEFADGLDFSATERAASQPPLLSVNVPIGLQFGSNPGNIEVRGTFQDTFEVPTIVNNEFESINVLDTLVFNWLNRPTNLVVAPGKTLALAGGNITVDGAQLFAPGGRVILGSVGPQSIIGIEPSGDFTYDRASNFQDIHLNHSATVNASGDGGGRLQFRGRQIRVTDDAVAIAYNLGDRSNTFSSIDIQADELTLQQEAALSSAALGNGMAGNISFQLETLTLNDRTVVAAGSLSSNSSSGIAIQATDSISITNTSWISTISVPSLGQKSGSIEIETRRLTLGNTGQISSSTGGFGQGGDIRIDASESITLQPGLFAASPSTPGALLSNGIFSTTEGDISDLGIGGDLIITTDRLTLNGAVISSSSTNGGQAGTVTIRANSLQAIGFPGFPEFPGSRVEFTGILSDGFAQGPAGSVFVQSDDVTLRDGGRLSVGNFDSGDAGTLTVVADTLTVEDRGEIAAFTISGEGGNIVLKTDTLVLRDQGRIFTDAGSTDGGNITIQTGVLAALENSDITANAIEGRGGRVSITAEGIFGTEFRLRTTEQSDITASSDSGPEFSGIVEINTPDVDSSAGLVELNAETTDPSREIVEGCAADRGNTFTVTGRGGLPPNPTQLLRGRALWHDERNLSAISNKNKQRLVEATNWIEHPNGQIELVAESQNQRDMLNAARNLSNLSLRYLKAGELSKAARTTAQGKQLLQQVSISPEAMSIQGSLLNTEGNIQLALGKTRVALDAWKKAAQSYQLDQDKFGVLGARINQAQALQSLGLYRGAKRLLESVNQQLETAPHPLMKATSLQSLGVTLQALGELDKSREILQQSLAISQQVGAEGAVSATLLGLGNTAKAKQTPETAIDFYQQAAIRANNSLEKAEALLNLLAVYVEEEKGDEAQALLPEIKAEIERIPGSRDRLYALINLAESWRRLAADLEIAKLLQVVIKEARELSDERGEAIALSKLALIYQETGELTTAQRLTEQSVLIAEGLGAQEIVARSQSQLGQILKQQGKV